MVSQPVSQESPNEFPAQAFHHSLPGGRASGVLHLTAAGLSFVCTGQELWIPYQRMELRLGGANDRLVFVSSEAHPGWSIYTAERSLLAHPLLRDHERASAVVGHLRSVRLRHHVLVALAVALFVAVPLLLIFNIDFFAGIAARQVPASWEENLGRSAYAQYELSHRIIEDSEATKLLASLTEPLTQAIEAPRYPFHFHISDDSSLNAFALPGGTVVIHTGLILKADSAAELQGVLAHEISHVTEQHGVRSIITSAGILVVAQAVLGDVSGLLAAAASAAPYLLNQRYSRGFERDADSRGMALLQRAHIDGHGMLIFFNKVQDEQRKMREKLRKKAGDNTADVLEGVEGFLSTHPATAERIERLQKLADAGHDAGQGPYREQDGDFQLLRERIKTLVTTTSEEQGEQTGHEDGDSR